MRGTIRTFDAAVRDPGQARLADYTADMARAYRAEAPR